MLSSTASHLTDSTGRAATSPMIHIGVLVPWANCIVEAELSRLCPPGVVYYYARLVPSSRHTALDQGFLDDLRAAVPAAVESLSQLPLDSVLMACTSAGFTRSSRCATSENTPDVLSAFDTLTGALNRLGIDCVALATPYPSNLTRVEANAFTEHGITVAAHVSLDRRDGYPDITGEQLDALLGRLDPGKLHGVGALVLSCTAWPTLDHLPRLERHFQVPVVSSNLALAAHAATLLPHEIPR